MDTDELRCTLRKKLPLKDITSIAFNGVHFVLTDPCNDSIILLDKNFDIFKTIDVKCKYTNICFDNTDNCYWAISNNNAYTVYQLDSCFRQLNQTHFKNAIRCKVTGISYDCFEKNIWLSFPNCIAYAKKDHNKLIYMENRRETMINRSILSLCRLIVVPYTEDCHQFIELCRDRRCKDLTACIPNGYTIKGICLISCIKSKRESLKIYRICLLLSQNCSSNISIVKCCLKLCRCDAPKLICEDLGSTNKHCNCDRSDGDGDCCNSCFRKCYYKAKCQVMQSIAMEEAAIAHILNAEGEKIQKAVAQCRSIDDLLCVNKSVKETIIHITQLETQLYLKLEAIQKNDSCKDPCDRCNRCIDNSDINMM